MNENKYNYFLDIHCHYEGLDPQILKKTLQENKIISLSASTDIDTYNYLEILRKQNIPNLYFAYGLYPDCILRKNLIENLEDLNKIDFSKANAIGEIGLDYKITKDKQKRLEQKKIFEKQLEIAKEYKKPVIIHTRYATKPTLEILSSWKDLDIVLHWFAGNEKEIETAIDRKYYLTQRFAYPLIKDIDRHINRIFIETDFPVPYNGKYTKPESIIESYNKFSEVYNKDLDFIKNKCIKNFEELFKIKL